ncbi:MAG: serine protease, partial [Pseudomonas sp.]|nr:serine protease [Pseudomonas sp.]
INIAIIPTSGIDAIRRPDLVGKDRVSVFMSFSEIDKEWRRYQYMLARKSKPAAPTSIKGFVAVAAKP